MNPDEKKTPRRRVGVAAALAAGNLGKPEVAVVETDEQREERERLEREQREREEREALERTEREKREAEERDRLARETREREERERLEREKAEALAASQRPPEGERRKPGRPKTLEGARRGRSFRASDPEYQAVYDTLDAIFTKVPPSIARRIEPSAIVRACLRIGKEHVDLVLKEIQDHDDFT